MGLYIDANKNLRGDTDEEIILAYRKIAGNQVAIAAVPIIEAAKEAPAVNGHTHDPTPPSKAKKTRPYNPRVIIETQPPIVPFTPMNEKEAQDADKLREVARFSGRHHEWPEFMLAAGRITPGGESKHNQYVRALMTRLLIAEEMVAVQKPKARTTILYMDAEEFKTKPEPYIGKNRRWRI